MCCSTTIIISPRQRTRRRMAISGPAPSPSAAGAGVKRILAPPVPTAKDLEDGNNVTMRKPGTQPGRRHVASYRRIFIVYTKVGTLKGYAQIRGTRTSPNYGLAMPPGENPIGA